ncbi:uncharacterized protein LOC132175344 isoform X3 [Corylus avellana]|uniref:uncharacterized protein LOC132175344 isoform X3 n=1 Tax=Corylus avellana TaxID=13451 RepID=UPI00286D66B5|nr:uncharacterized protein LOC132175344 isoform X3 [Corylus avellana]
MKKVRFRTVRELYGGTEEEEGLVPIKGSSCTEEQFDRHFSRCEFQMGEESRTCNFSNSTFQKAEECSTCNVPATPCSPSMHLERMASVMVTKVDAFSDEACKRRAACGSSSSDVDLLSPSSSSGCNGRQHTSSEISNVFSACCSHDSFSENVESKPILKSTDVSENIEMHVKVNTGPTAEGQHDFPKVQIIYPQVYSIQLQKQKEMECLGDNVSCISRSDYTKMIVGDHHGDANMKNLLCTSASVDSVPAVEKAINDQPACHYLASSSHFDKVDNHDPWRPNFDKESAQAVADISSKSDQSEISSLRDLCAGANLLKGEPSDCSEEQVESSLKRVATFRVGRQMQDVHNLAASMIDDAEMNNGNLAVEAVLCLDQKDHIGNSCAVVAEPNIQEPPLQSQIGDCNDTSITLEDEVKVCDICGDVGREESLSICSKCYDGAEHIYCMRVKLDKVPEGDWMCEECMLGVQMDIQNEAPKTARTSNDSFMNRIVEISTNASAFRFKSGLKLNVEGSDVEEIQTKKENSSSLLSAKKHARNSEAGLVTKRCLETSVKSSRASRTFSKSLLHGKSSSKNSDDCLPAVTGDKPSQLQSQIQLQRGSLFKSKSFNITDSKVKGHLAKDVSVQKQKIASITTVEDKRKEGRTRILCKSLSFDNNSLHLSNAADAKVTKECQSTQVNYTAEFHPTVSSPVASSGISSSSVKENASRGETFSSVSNYHDLEAVQGHELSHNSLNPFSHLVQQGLKYPDGFDDVSRHVEHSTEAASATKENHSNTMFPSNEIPYLRNFPWFTAAIPSQISAVPQLHCIWQGEFEIQRSVKLPSSCNGVQAHLSTYASPKVLEVVLKLPQKIILQEVPRLSIWPTQFSENHATEDNIALYFFAKDLGSYGRNYKSLLERMIKNDSALKVNLDGAELLIFSSNSLPENSQRWNKLLFFWGVFRGRRVSCSQDIQSSKRREERDVRRQETDLKRRFQESEEYVVDQERECKRMKSCFSVAYGCDGSTGTKYLGDRLPSFENPRWGGVYSMAASSPERQILPNDERGRSEHGVPNLELCLGVENKSNKQGVMPSFLGIMDNRTDQDKHFEPQVNKSNKDDDEVSLSLSLSLALPFSNN